MVHCPGEGVPTVSLSLSPDLHVHLFGGLVVWSVFLSNGPDTCTCECCATWDDVTILGPYPNFLLFSTILLRALGHSFPTRSLTRRSDRHQIT